MSVYNTAPYEGSGTWQTETMQSESQYQKLPIYDSVPEETTSLVGGGAVAAQLGEGWGYTPYISKSGNPIGVRTITVKKGKMAGRSRSMYGEYRNGKYYRVSLEQATTGKKPRAKSTPKRKICKGEGKRKGKKSGKKSEYMKAKGKFMRQETAHGRKVDKSKQAKKVVYSAKKYDPKVNDFGGLDTKRK